MDKEVQENSMSAVVGPSEDDGRVFNWHKQQPNEQKLFQNNLTEIGSTVENSTECNVNVVIREKMICQLLAKDSSIYDKNAHGETLLQAAFKEGCYDALRSALDNLTGNFNPANKDDVIHFHIACVTNHYLAAENYLKCGLDPNSLLSLDYAEYSGLNPVEFAIEKNYSELFVRLVKYNGDLSRKNVKGLTPLHMIYYSSFPANGKSWIEQAFKYGNDKKFINSEDGYGVQHFHLSCMLNEPDFVQAFIDNGANVNDPVSLTCPLNPGFTPLHFAIINGCEKVTELLLKSGADPNKQDKEGKTPLYLTAEIYNEINYTSISLVLPDIVKIMLKYKANPFITDMNGATPLHVSFYKAKTRPGTSPWPIFLILMSELENKWGSINYTDDHGLSLFHIACYHMSFSLILNFLNSGVNVNSRVSSGVYGGYTALHFAVKVWNYRHFGKKQKTLQVLLERGAKVNEKENEFGYTPLGIMCEQGPGVKRLISMLLEHKASPVIADKKGSTPLHKCFHKAEIEGFEILDALVSEIQWGSDNCTDDEGLSLFHIACTTNDVRQVTKFLNSGVNVNSRVSSGTYVGFTALHFAVMHNQKEVVEILLKRNVNINDRAGKSAVTPLHLACEFNYRKFNQEYKCCSNQKDIIKLLLLQGAEVNAKDSNGLTPLLLACMIGNSCKQRNWSDILSYHKRSHYNTIRNILYYDISVRLHEVITILISNKADINARTKDQWTALHIISKYRILKNSETLVKLLLISGIEVNAVADDGVTPLHIALMYNNNNVFTSLLNHNANPNVESNDSGTPLSIATHNIMYPNDQAEDTKEREAFLTLLENGSEVNIRNERGELLLHTVIKACNYFLIDNLLKYGADINMEDSHGNCSVSYLLERTYDRHLCCALRIIFFHMKWLEALKLPINPKVQNCYDRLYSRYEKDLQESSNYVSPNENYIQCRTELDMLKNVKIDRYTSLYDILLKDPRELIKHVENINLVELATNDNIYKKFPLYGYLLKRKIKRGLKRREISQSADTALRYVLNINLPDLCCDLVLKYLTNEEIANLVKAAPIKRNLTRKSCDSSSQNETVRKLRKTETD